MTHKIKPKLTNHEALALLHAADIAQDDMDLLAARMKVEPSWAKTYLARAVGQLEAARDVALQKNGLTDRG
jgi:hypothetical protein